MQIIDTHAHLDHLPDFDNAIQRSYQSGVEAIVAMSMDIKSCERNLEIKRTVSAPQIYVALGMHPSEVKFEELETIVELITHHRKDINAVGEIGLDFWYKWVRKDEDKKNQQRQVYRRLLSLAKDFNLPAVVHARGAWRECLDTVIEIGVKKVNFHWYSGPLDVLKDIMDEGHFVSASPSLAHSPQLREAIAAANIKQVLIETDCPVYYGDKEAGTGFAAEPKDVVRTLKAYCELMNVDEDKTREQFNQNARLFFGLS